MKQKETPNNPSALFFRSKKLFFLITGFLFFTRSLWAQDCIANHGQGQVNWTTGQITVVGKAVPADNTVQEIESLPGSARADANRNLIRLLKQIKIFHGLTVGQYAGLNDRILGGIEETARDAVPILQTYTSAMDFQIKISMKFHGGFLQLILPEDIRQISKVNLASTAREFRPQHSDNHQLYTGLIIDAGAVMTEPVLYPIVVDENGREIYSSQFISREFAVQFGICAYTPDMKTALSQERIGTNPLVVKAIRETPGKKTFLLIPSADAKKLEKTSERHEFFKKCQVVIICKNLSNPS